MYVRLVRIATLGVAILRYDIFVRFFVLSLSLSTNCFHFHYAYAMLASDMGIVRTILPYIQLILSVLLVAAILLQQRGSSLGGAFGGDNFSATYHKRRGAELFLYRFSIALAILFVASAFLSLII